jgi:hypothetical protein
VKDGISEIIVVCGLVLDRWTEGGFLNLEKFRAI